MTDSTTPSHADGKKYQYMKRIAVIVILALLASVHFLARVNVQVFDGYMKALGTFSGSVTIPYDDVVSISLTDNHEIGIRSFGANRYRVQCGRFKNNAYGNYYFYAYRNQSSYIVVQTAERTAVFNLETEEATRALYETLKEKINQRQEKENQPDEHA